MVSDYNPPRPPDEGASDAGRVRDAAAREAGSAREEAGRFGEQVRGGAAHLGSNAKEKVYEKAEAGKSFAAGSLDDFTAAIRKASDELGERDQSMAANLVREAASGLEQVSGAIQGKSVQELTRSVAGFARRQPAAFLIGAALAGVALGRFAKASSDHDEHRFDHGGRSGQGGAYRGAYRDEARDRSAYDGAAGSDRGAASGSSGSPSTGSRFPSVSGSSASSGTGASFGTGGSASGSSASSGGTAGPGAAGTAYRSAASSAGLAGVTADITPVRPGAVSEPGTKEGDHDR